MAREELLSSFDRDPAGSSYPGALGKEGLSIFDGSSQGGFEVKIRGYDRGQVEERIRKLEHALAYTKAMNRQLDQQITQLRQRLGEREQQHSERPDAEPTDDGPSE